MAIHYGGRSAKKNPAPERSGWKGCKSTVQEQHQRLGQAGKHCCQRQQALLLCMARLLRLARKIGLHGHLTSIITKSSSLSKNNLTRVCHGWSPFVSAQGSQVQEQLPDAHAHILQKLNPPHSLHALLSHEVTVAAADRVDQLVGVSRIHACQDVITKTCM